MRHLIPVVSICVAPGEGGKKTATVSVTVNDWGVCHVTLKDKKGNTATVNAVINFEGSCFA